MEEEKLKILELLEKKKISPEDSLLLLEAVGAGSDRREMERFLRLRVYEGGESPRVNISVPLEWAKYLAPLIDGKIRARLAAKGQTVDMAKMQAAIELAEPATLLSVQDGKDRLEIFIE